MLSCSRICVLLSTRLLVLSCSNKLLLSCSPAGMPSCDRAPKLSCRNEWCTALILLLILLLASFALTPPPALSSSHAEAYAPTATRFPFLDSTGLRMVVHSGCLITCILRIMIMPLAPCESQTGGFNLTYFTYDRALGRFHAAVGSVIGPIWVAPIMSILRMIVHMGV